MTASAALRAAQVMHVLSAFPSGQTVRPHGRTTVETETRRS